MKSIQNSAALFFITAVAVLSVISVFGVWDIVSGDAIYKSFLTLGLLALVAIVVMVAGRYMGDQNTDVAAVAELPNPAFEAVRKATLVILIGAVSLLALFGVMAIWEIIDDEEVLYKSLGSLAILAFGAFMIVVTCLERENKFKRQSGKDFSVGAVIGLIFLGMIFFSFIMSFM